MPADMENTIFVISPIGADESPQRRDANQLFKYVITPVAQLLGYEVERADKLDTPGTISTQIIRYLLESRLVVADMTGHNPNVFYELAVRHAARKPIVHMIQNGEQIPFDVAPQRAIFYDLDLDGVDAAKSALERQARAALDGSGEPETPLTNALQRILLSQSEEPTKQLDSKILDLLEDIRLRVSKIEAEASSDNPPDLPKKRTSSQGIIAWWRETLSFFKFLARIIELDDNPAIRRAVAEELESLWKMLELLDASGGYFSLEVSRSVRQLYYLEFDRLLVDVRGIPPF